MEKRSVGRGQSRYEDDDTLYAVVYHFPSRSTQSPAVKNHKDTTMAKTRHSKKGNTTLEKATTANEASPKITKRSSGAISNTKAKAMRRKSKPVAVLKATITSSKDGGSRNNNTPEMVLLANLMEHYLARGGTLDGEEESNESEGGLSFTDILQSLGMNDRNTGWRNTWKDLHQRGLTQQVLESHGGGGGGGGGGFFTGAFCLTQSGIEAATTDELKAVMIATAKNKPKTNAEHHEFIKGKLMNDRGVEIFDILLKNHHRMTVSGEKEEEEQPHLLSRIEIAKTIGISDRGAYFSYALQQLKELGYVEDVTVDGMRKKKKLRLTSKCFIVPIQKQEQGKPIEEEEDNDDDGEDDNMSSEEATPEYTKSL